MFAPFMTDEFFAGLESSTCDVNAAETLPPLCYSDPLFYEFEKEAIFFHEWLCVGREAWARNPGDYFTAFQVGEPIIVARSRDGTLKAMSAVCRHRAMLVAEGYGNVRTFVCPYHHWTYALDGRLVHAPEMDKARNFSQHNFRLPELKLEIWNGFVFVNFDPDAAPLAPRLASLTEALRNYHLTEADERSTPSEPRKEPWNWKVRYENSNDGYHANRLHGGPVHDCVPSALARFPELPPDTAGYFRYNGTTHQDCSFNPTLKATLPIFPDLTLEERNRFLFMCVPPTLTFNCSSDIVNFNLFSIDGPCEMSSRRGFLVARGAMRQPLFEERLNLIATTNMSIVEQDRHVDKLVQIGLQSKFAIRGRYSWQEQSQRELNGWIVQRYRAAWARLPARAIASRARRGGDKCRG
jgi:phenylpropionate dioxygenase-like ring-hydroxylating dioxygenase large terminal subunit